MTPLTLDSARHMRDGGIDAMAALDHALGQAITGVPPHQQWELKRAFGQIMGDITTTLINPALTAFPELKLDERTWTSIAKTCAATRSDAV